MIDDSYSIIRHCPFYKDYQNMLLIDFLPKSQSSLPKDIENQLDSILRMLDPTSPMINEVLINLSQLIKEYGHSVHPYISSLDISNLILLLDSPNLREIVLSILWSCSFLSPDIIGYFLEADSFIQKIISIFYTNINNDSKLIIVKLINGCLSQYSHLTTILESTNFFNNLIQYCQSSNVFITMSSILLYHCKISESFVKSALPIMQFIITNTNDIYSISRILFVLAESNKNIGLGNIINQFIISNYLPQLKYFLDNATEILIIEATITMLYSMVLTNGPEIALIIYKCGILFSILNWLFQINNTNAGIHENNNLSSLILTFLSTFLKNSAQNEELITDVIKLLLASDIANFCKESTFPVCEQTVLFILDVVVNFSKDGQAKKLISRNFFEILIQLFESADNQYRNQICYKLHSILLLYGNNSEFCDMINKMWIENNICANYCLDLTEDDLLIFEI